MGRNLLYLCEIEEMYEVELLTAEGRAKLLSFQTEKSDVRLLLNW